MHVIAGEIAVNDAAGEVGALRIGGNELIIHGHAETHMTALVVQP